MEKKIVCWIEKHGWKEEEIENEFRIRLLENEDKQVRCEIMLRCSCDRHKFQDIVRELGTITVIETRLNANECKYETNIKYVYSISPIKQIFVLIW